MWKVYFPKAQIFGIDIHDKSALEENRIRIFHGSQSDPTFLEQVIATIGTIDIVIDDGSHINEDVIFSFNSLFPSLSKTGIYVIEDTQTFKCLVLNAACLIGLFMAFFSWFFRNSSLTETP